MKFYNSLTKIIEEINLDTFNIYNCGPTVYNDIHIGNARPLIVFDVLHRTLLANNKKVNFLHNLTDIDDKIINAAIENNMNELELSEKYGIAYKKIREELNTLPLIIEKVSDNINGIINYIDRLIKNGTAYNLDGNIYFDTSKYSEYGCLSNRKLDEQFIGERVAAVDNKKNETDFVLWKKTNLGIQWDTKWSKGRPGWHSECSYLIEKYFGTNLTIHGGGIDLKFPHHENENAQHFCLHNHGLSKIWMHVGHVNIDSQKMSKSLNNFILVKDILKNTDYQSLRWFMYKTNYRNPLDFNDLIIKECKVEISKIKNTINKSKSILIYNNVYSKNNQLPKSFMDELNNDLNITNAITILQNYIKKLNICIREKKLLESNILLNWVINSLIILGVEFDDLHTDKNIILIKEYFDSIDLGQFEISDKLRTNLIDKGLI